MALTDDIRKKIQKQGMEVAMKLMADDRTRPYVAKAMQSYMENKQKADAIREELLSTMGLASEEQLKKVKSDARKLERKIDTMQKRLDEIQALLAG